MTPTITRRPLILAATLLVVSVASAAAQTSPKDPRIDRLFAQWDKPDSPGCSVGVVKNGRFVYERGYGMANLDYAIPNSPKMVYYVGSVSKQFTAAAIALLALDGRIKLDDDIRKYFPEMPDYGRPVTIDQLVHHTSGVRDMYVLMSLGGLRIEDVTPDSESVSLIARQKALNFMPGDDHLYSNSGYFLLAQLVKRVTGKSLRVFADERIFQPLGMTHTHFHDDPGHIMKDRAMSYEPDSVLGFRISYLQNFDKIGAGGLYTTLDDLRKWDENYYTHKVGGDAFQTMVHTRAVLTKGDTLPYAFGNNVMTYRGLRTDEHGGALMGYRAEVLRFPDQKFSALITCNLGNIDPSAIAYSIADIYLGDKMGAKPAPRTRPQRASNGGTGGSVSAADLSSLVGTYYSDELDATYRIVASNGRLVLQRHRELDEPLVPAGADAYRAGPLTLHFERSGGAPSAFTIEAGRVRNIRFARR